MQLSISHQMLFPFSDSSTEDMAISTSEIDQENRELERMKGFHHHDFLI